MSAVLSSQGPRPAVTKTARLANSPSGTSGAQRVENKLVVLRAEINRSQASPAHADSFR